MPDSNFISRYRESTRRRTVESVKRTEEEKIPKIEEELQRLVEEGLLEEEDIKDINFSKEAKRILETIQEISIGVEELTPEEQEKSRKRFWRDMFRFFRLEKDYQKTERQLQAFLWIQANRDNLDGVCLQGKIGELLDEAEKIKEELEKLPDTSPEAFLGISRLELKRYVEQLRSGNLVETPWVKKIKTEIIENLKSARSVFLYGETGTGKTEIAKQIAREITGKEPVVIRGHRFMTPEEIWGYLGLAPIENKSESVLTILDEIDKENKIDRESIKKILEEIDKDRSKEKEIIKKITIEILEKLGKETIVKFLKKKMGISEEIYGETQKETEAEKRKREEEEEEVKLIADYFLETLREEKEGKVSGQVETKFFAGPLVKAAKEGRILIIDEANYIPPQLLASLNEILSNPRAGREITVPYTGEVVEIQEGFGIIMTGNITFDSIKRYRERYEIDPALKDRVKFIEFNTPPMETDRSKDYKESGERDLFLIALAALADDKGNLVLPGGEKSLLKIWRLCQAFKLFQDNFAGRSVVDYVDATGAKYTLALEKNHASMRKLINILREWKKYGMRYELDWYVWKELIEPALTEPQEAAYFYQILQNLYDFFSSEGWDKTPNYGEGLRLKTFQPKIPSEKQKPKAEPLEVIPYDKIAESIRGKSIIPILEKLLEEEERERQRQIEETRNIEMEIFSLEEEYQKEFNEIEAVCPPELMPEGMQKKIPKEIGI